MLGADKPDKVITQDQLEKLRQEIKSSRDKADEIIDQNTKLKERSKKMKECFEVVIKKALKMNSKLAKFSKQVSKVMNLEQKYTHLHKLTQ